MLVTYVNIDDQELNVDFIENDQVEEGVEGHWLVQVTKEGLTEILHAAGFREVPQ